MKNLFTILLSIIFSILIGTCFMQTTSETDEIKVSSTYGSVIAFQIGAYESLDNATDISKVYDGTVVKQDNVYLVYVAVLSNTKNIERMMNILDENNIYYYTKVIDIDTKLNEELRKYEELMLKTTSDVAFKKLVYQYIKLYGETHEF